jgi:hypothetical protein
MSGTLVSNGVLLRAHAACIAVRASAEPEALRMCDTPALIIRIRLLTKHCALQPFIRTKDHHIVLLCRMLARARSTARKVMQRRQKRLYSYEAIPQTLLQARLDSRG